MKKVLTIPVFNLTMNLLIIYVFLSGVSIVLNKSYKLCFRTDEIELIRLEIPWIRPISDVTIMLHKNILEKNANIHKKVSKNIFIHDLIERISLLTLSLLILIQLKKLIIAINMKTFFKLRNLLIIRSLSLLVVIWVFCNFIIYQLIPVFISFQFW